MKKILCVLLCVCLLGFAACQNGERADLPELEMSAESSAKSGAQSGGAELSSSGETSAPSGETEELSQSLTPEEIKAASSELSVPIRIVTINDNPEVYQMPKGRGALGTEEHLKIYEEWIANLDAAAVTAIYGYVGPVSEYTPGKMELEDTTTPSPSWGWMI